jgi:hypothetical protein
VTSQCRDAFTTLDPASFATYTSCASGVGRRSSRFTRLNGHIVLWAHPADPENRAFVGKPLYQGLCLSKGTTPSIGLYLGESTEAAIEAFPSTETLAPTQARCGNRPAIRRTDGQVSVSGGRATGLPRTVTGVVGRRGIPKLSFPHFELSLPHPETAVGVADCGY